MELEIVGAYPVPEAEEPCHLLEWRLSGYTGPFEVGELVQPEADQPPENWQVPYDEYVLSAEGTSGESTKLEPVAVSGEARFCFFYFYLRPEVPFSTPAGSVAVPTPSPRPARLEFVAYEDP